jgi:hypothetical protein
MRLPCLRLRNTPDLIAKSAYWERGEAHFFHKKADLTGSALS